MGEAARAVMRVLRRGDEPVLRTPSYYEADAAVEDKEPLDGLVVPDYQQRIEDGRGKEEEGEKENEEGGGKVSGGDAVVEDGGDGELGLGVVDMDLEEGEFGSDPSERVPRGVWRDAWGNEGGLRREMNRTYTIEEETASEVEAEMNGQVEEESPTDSYDSDDPVSSSPPGASFSQVICACVGAV